METRRRILMAEPWCRICKVARAWEIDHIVPLSAGGTDARSNLRPLCVTCHKSKSAAERVTVVLSADWTPGEGQGEGPNTGHRPTSASRSDAAPVRPVSEDP